jgi:hypothetical protein
MRKRGGVKPLPLTAERAVQWLTAMDPSAFDPRLRAQQTEALYVFSRFGMTAVDSEAFSDGTNVDSQLNARASLSEPEKAAISGNIANDEGNAFVEEDTVYDLY